MQGIESDTGFSYTTGSVVNCAAIRVDTLRRSSGLVTPTRTLRLSEAEIGSRSPAPFRGTVEELTNRPRSNTRTRTPRRYESPLNPDEFRQRPVAQEGAELSMVLTANSQIENGIRTTMHSAEDTNWGFVLSNSVRDDRASKSRKQGPSHRKIRRWNNDRFNDIANEIARDSVRGQQVGDVFAKAKKDAHLYRDVIDLSESKSETFTRFFNDVTLCDVRESYWNGELPIHCATPRQSRKESASCVTSEDHLNRVEGRLRRVILKAVSNSYPAVNVLHRFESFVVELFSSSTVTTVLHNTPLLETSTWAGLLLKPPLVSIESLQDDEGTLNEIISAKCFFDPDSPTSGFHRLLLHAVVQFHGIEAVSLLVNIEQNCKLIQVKALTARGRIRKKYSHRLLTACEARLSCGE